MTKRLAQDERTCLVKQAQEKVARYLKVRSLSLEWFSLLTGIPQDFLLSWGAGSVSVPLLKKVFLRLVISHTEPIVAPRLQNELSRILGRSVPLFFVEDLILLVTPKIQSLDDLRSPSVKESMHMLLNAVPTDFSKL
jgi:hypothetical protein